MRQRSGYDLLKAEMASRDLKQGALERALGVTKGTASRWLSSVPGQRRCPGLASALAIERLLGIPASAWTLPARRSPSAKKATT